MKASIMEAVELYVRAYPALHCVETSWRTPLVAFAAADDPLFNEVRRVIGPSYCFPGDLLPEARTAITYFIPFDPATALQNVEGQESSSSWAVAYAETNRMLQEINQFLCSDLEQRGFKAAFFPAAHKFDATTLMGYWSHRHAAYIAGLGTFGLNNMLITKQGCCGRLGTVISDIPVDPTPRPKIEHCLFKRDGKCGACAERCVGDALSKTAFIRHNCFEVCRKNAARFPQFGVTNVCGKCLVGVPCSFCIPDGVAEQ